MVFKNPIPIAVISCMLCLMNAACGNNDLSKINAISAKVASRPVERSHSITIIYSDSAKVKAKLTSPYFLSYHIDKPYQEMPNGLHIDFYDAAVEIQSKLDAGYGIRYEKEHRIEVRNNVVVINKMGEKMNTEKLDWDEDKKKIYTDKYVKITRSDGIYEGEGLDANEDFTNYTFRKFTGVTHMVNP